MPTATTTTTKKKTTRPKKISVDEAEAEKKKAIDEAIKKERQKAEEERIAMEANIPDDHDFDDEYDDTPSFGHSNGAYYEDSEINEIEDIMQFGMDLEEQGRDISYYIRKDGAFIDEIFVGIPLKDFASKWGGGKYTISIKDEKGRWIKQKTHRIAGPSTPPKAEEKQSYISQQQSMPQIDLNQTFKGFSDMFMQMQEMTQREKSKIERDEKKSSDTFNSTLFSVISEQGKSTQTMIMEMQRNNMEMLKAISENTTRSLEKAEERNREMLREIRDSSSKKEEFGLKEMLALIESSRNNGMDTMKTVMELSETFAEMRAAHEPAESGSKDSMLSSLIQGFLPLLNKANQNMQVAQPVPGQAGMPQQRRLQTPIPQAQAPRVATAPAPQARAGHQVARTQTSQSPIQGAGQYQETPISAGSLGLPSFADKRAMPHVPQRGAKVSGVGSEESPEEFIEKIHQELKAETPGTDLDQGETIKEQIKMLMPFIRESDVYKEGTRNQKLIVEIALPIMAQFMNNEAYQPETVAQFVLDECMAQGFEAETVAKEFSLDFINKIATGFGITEKADWLGAFYETIAGASQTESDLSGLESDEPSIS